MWNENLIGVLNCVKDNKKGNLGVLNYVDDDMDPDWSDSESKTKNYVLSYFICV